MTTSESATKGRSPAVTFSTVKVLAARHDEAVTKFSRSRVAVVKRLPQIADAFTDFAAIRKLHPAVSNPVVPLPASESDAIAGTIGARSNAKNAACSIAKARFRPSGRTIASLATDLIDEQGIRMSRVSIREFLTKSNGKTQVGQSDP